MSSNDNIDRLYWIAFAKLIEKEIGKLGDSNAFFLSTKSQRGPPVEPYNAAYTDYGIYNFSNQLLNSDNLFYTPSSTNTYTGALMAYLSWVDVGGDPSNEQMLDVMAKKKIYDLNQSNLMVELRKANLEYQERLNMGVIAKGQSFVQWLPNNAPGYADALNVVNTSAGQYKSAVLSLNGPLSGQWSQQMNNLNLASNSYDKDKISGITMQVTASAPPTISDAFIASNGGPKLPDPTDLYSVAQFGSPEYHGIVAGWQKSATKAPAPTGSFQLNLSDAKNVKDTDFGHTKLDGDLSITYGSIFSFGTDASSDTTEDTLSTKVTETNVKITVSWDATAKASLKPGAWNIDNPHGNYPNLKPGAPQSARILVLPTQVLLVSKLAYEVQFFDNIKTEFDKKVTDTKSGGGYIRIFGIPIGVGAQVATQTTNTTHVGTWNSEQGIFSVKPTPDAGYATVLAVVGEKVQTF